MICREFFMIFCNPFHCISWQSVGNTLKIGDWKPAQHAKHKLNLNVHVGDGRLSWLVLSSERLLVTDVLTASAAVRWLLLRLSKHQLPTVFLKTTLTWTIYHHQHVTIVPGSNHLLYYEFKWSGGYSNCFPWVTTMPALERGCILLCLK